jgi:single-strand DNA-binding protein
MNAIEVALIGRLGSDPELRTGNMGKPWCSFSVCCGEGDDQQWVRVSAFNDTAKRAVEQLAKGDKAYIEGKIRLNEWTSRDGQHRYGLQVSAWRVDAIGKIGQRKVAEKPAEKATPVSARNYQAPLNAECEIPF